MTTWFECPLLVEAYSSRILISNVHLETSELMEDPESCNMLERNLNGLMM